jgi:hypothetical protein
MSDQNEQFTDANLEPKPQTNEADQDSEPTTEMLPNPKTLAVQTKPLKVNLPFILQVSMKRADLETFENGGEFNQDSYIATQLHSGIVQLAKNPKDLVRILKPKPGERTPQQVSFALDHLNEYGLRKLATEYFKLTRREIRLAQLANLALIVTTETLQS